jgi:anti-sigma regulatory factor (Ser/Thr protein kinase)
MQTEATTGSKRLVVRSRLDELQRLATWAETVASDTGLSSEQAFAIQLCLEEAVANIIMYGGAADDAPITVQIVPSAGAVSAIIEDSARAFDPTKVTPRAKPVSLDQARVGELGVHLIRHYSSRMHYERHDDRNRLTLTFGRPQALTKDAGQ